MINFVVHGCFVGADALTRVRGILLLVMLSFATTMAAAPMPMHQLEIPALDAFPQHPRPYAYMDWKQRALEFDTLIYNRSNVDSIDKNGKRDGLHFSTILSDDSHQAVDYSVHNIAAYYGSDRIQTHGRQEAINLIAGVVGSSLLGIDKSNQNNTNYVINLLMFNSVGRDYNLIRNNPSPKPFEDWWYDTLPNVLFYMLADLYPDEKSIQQPLAGIADEYHDMTVDLMALPGGLNFSFLAFDHDNDKPVLGNHTVPEAGIMSALILYWAYHKFGDTRYLDSAKQSMDFFNRSNTNPYYEIGPVWGPYLAARMNAEQGTNYDIERYFNWLVSGSDVRPGWGTITESWSGYDVHGVQGSRSDGGGYAFLMNTFATAFLAPAVKYDFRLANTVGKWLLSTSNAARFFYPDMMPAKNQYHGETYINEPEKVIGYEGLRKKEVLDYSTVWPRGTVHAPNATGDPAKYGENWGLSALTTNLGIYGSSWVGFMAAIVQKTTVEQILQIDLNALDFYSESSYPTYLYYNPYDEDKSIEIRLEASSDLYDAVTDSHLGEAVSGLTSITVPANNSVVLVLSPAGSLRSKRAGRTYIDGVLVRYQHLTTP